MDIKKTILVCIEIAIICYCILISNVIAGTIETESLNDNDKLVDPNVVFVSAGDSFDENYVHYRVILNVMEIYSVLIIQKVMPENEEQEPKILWSRYLSKGIGNQFISPNDFKRSFKWEAPDSFSFMNNGKKYIIENIGEKKPNIKKIKS